MWSIAEDKSLGPDGGLASNPRLRESLSTVQADNLALGEKLQDLVRPQPGTPFLCCASSLPPSPAPVRARGRQSCLGSATHLWPPQPFVPAQLLV